jgi:selenocysteine-specific elongation factor
MIIGTAGHIDHGKTSLVRALSGVDTDRLLEEKRRGISIELGYAYMPTPSGKILGFVDVPGHERFIHTMLAGATAIDFALLVIAADDGIMPQTREHVGILDLLGLTNWAVAITKIDRVAPERVEEVRRQIVPLLDKVALAPVPVFQVSALSGEGIESLRASLCDFAEAFPGRRPDGRFRLAVDRSFSLDGVGTVVTGMAFSGSVRAGDSLVVAPGGKAVRVRGLHAQNRPAQTGVAGQRCALNLAGVGAAEVSRGAWMVAAESALETERIDVAFTLLGSEERKIQPGTPVHLHLGAAHVSGRVALLEPEAIEPGQSGLAQLLLAQPVAAWHADRFILRDQSARRTLGGGMVLDPFAPKRYRRSPERLRALRALWGEQPRACLTTLVAHAEHGVDLGKVSRAFNLADTESIWDRSAMQRILKGGRDFLIGNSHWNALKASALQALARFHEGNPDELGPDLRRLKRLAFPAVADELIVAALDELLAAGSIGQSGSWLHLPEHSIRLSAQDRKLAERIRPLLLQSPFDPPWVRDLARGTGEPEVLVRATMRRLARSGEIYQVVKDLFYDTAAVRELAAIADEIQAARGEILAADFRDRTGLGRKRAIQILEFFDRVGFTRRVRDKHVVRADNPLFAGRSPLAGGGTAQQHAR